MSGHTPGPWAIFNCDGEGPDYYPGIDAANLTTIVMWGAEGEEDAGVRGRTAEERLANAHLIAAAPALLQTLKVLTLNDRLDPEDRNLIRAAITLAEPGHG